MADNIKTKIDKNVLTITIDLKQSQGKSKSGKNELIATTKGNMDLGHEGIKMGLNIYRPATGG